MGIVFHGTLSMNALRYGSRLAIDTARGALSHREFDERTSNLAAGLASAGLAPGDHCALLMGNRVEFLESIYAMSKAGVVFSALNAMLTPPEKAALIRHFDARALIVDAENADAIEHVPEIGEAVDRELMFCVDPHPGFRHLDELRVTGARPAHQSTEDDWLRIAYTSGTTGDAKGVIIPHRVHIGNFLPYFAEFLLTHRDRILVCSPVFFQGGLTWSTLPFLIGATLQLDQRFDAGAVLRSISEGGVTAAFLVPTMVRAILDELEANPRRYDVQHFRVLVSGGSPANRRMREEMMRLLPATGMYDSYGATEAGSVTLLHHEDQLRKIGTVGQPVLGSEVEIRGDDGVPVAPGEPGELWARGLGVADGYYKNEKATSETFVDGWVAIGDVGSLDDEGFFTLLDRKKDIIITGGINVYPKDVEEVLAQHAHVTEVAVVGVNDEKWGERIVAAVVRAPGADVSVGDLHAWCAAHLPPFKRPKEIALVDALPRNAAGKVLRREVADSWSTTSAS